MKIFERIDPPDADQAFDAWGANCGPAALAAFLGTTLEDVREAVSPGGSFKGHMGILDMVDALQRIANARREVTFMHLGRPTPPPSTAPRLVLINWRGPWTGTRGESKFRHWIALVHDQDGTAYVYDVNCGWTTRERWDREIVPTLIPPRGFGTYNTNERFQRILL